MHSLLRLLAISAAATALPLQAQTPAPATAPPPTARPPQSGPVLSPEVQPDQRVTFRLRAPDAREVSVSTQGIQGRVALSKDESGVWSAAAGPIEPGVWEYTYTIDGVQTIDPGNPAIKPQRQPKSSILHIASDPPAAWDFQNVPHGTMHWHDYAAKSLGGQQRRLHVYTPPGYEGDAAAKYPVLYLVHGSGDNDAAWSVHGKANWILDSLIAQKKARPMIVVMPDGHPVAPGSGPREGYGNANLEAFERDLTEDILPLIESTYRVRGEPSQHALAGLSMGGGHTLFTGLKHLDRFAFLGAFSAGVPADRTAELLGDPTAINEHLQLFWIACGKGDFLLERNRQLVAALGEKGIRHTWVESEGDHSWPVWRRYLIEFAPLLFPDKATPQ